MTELSRRTLIAAMAASSVPVASWAQSASTLTLVVPFPAGGSTDALARMIQNGLQTRTGRRVFVENKAGGAGAIGAAQVAKAAGDGSSLLVTFDSHAVIPALVQKPPLDVEKDMQPLLLVGTAPYVLVASSKHEFKSVNDIIAAAKAKPGSLRYGSAGPGTIGHLSMVLLGNTTGTELIHVPYRGAAPALNDLLGGHVDLVCASAAIIAPQVSSLQMRPIVQFGNKRLDVFKDTPTIAEAGHPGLEALAWWGIFAPKATPSSLSQELADHLKAVIADPTLSAKLKETQQMEVVLASPDEFGSFFTRQVKVWGEVVRKNNITM